MLSSKVRVETFYKSFKIDFRSKSSEVNKNKELHYEKNHSFGAYVSIFIIYGVC